MRPPYLDVPFVALAHRGFSTDGRENSMHAFAAARDLGFTYVETDAHATVDEVAVALHDATLDRTTDAVGIVAELPWRTVRTARIDGREPIPTLEELLGTWPEMRVNIDVKSLQAAAPVAAAIERTAAHDRVCIASFSPARRRATTARLTRPVTTSAGRSEVAAALLNAYGPASVVRLRRALGGVDCLQVPEMVGRLRVVGPGLIRTASAAQRDVHVWTVNDAQDMRRLIDLGVTGIVTDRADLLRSVLIERGLW